MFDPEKYEDDSWIYELDYQYELYMGEFGDSRNYEVDEEVWF